MRTLEPSRFQQVCAGDLVLLHKSGCALSNLPSLPHITVAGSVATATHGSGNANRSLAYGVTGMSLITGTGDQVLVDHRRASIRRSGGAPARWVPDTAAVTALRLADFRRLVEAYDPRGIFRNAYLSRTILA